MGSYYPAHGVLQTLTGLDVLNAHIPNDSGGFARGHGEHDSSSARPIHYCSVRGCSTVLSFEYTHKMCEACRSRHRTYASTKRAKRKQEKAMLGAQAGAVWIPDGSSGDVDAHTAPIAALRLSQPPPPLEPELVSEPVREIETPPVNQTIPATSYGYPSPASWDSSALDPQLFQQRQPSSSSSELANALTMPVSSSLHPYSMSRTRQSSTPVADPLSQAPSNYIPAGGPSGSAYPPAVDSQGSSIAGAASSSALPVQQPPRTVLHPKGIISTKSISEAAAQMESNYPPRYCSIKGCKTLIPGDSFFKMCEPCRDRYRNYGTTKRRKWKREKEEAVAEMERLREEENRQRIANGLPPLSDPEPQVDWQDDGRAAGGSHPVIGSKAPRMCTVSHCREILPGNYDYLRCERHRVQNRHHSKLKRVRDKESKAQALEGWVAAVGAQAAAARASSEEFRGDSESLFEDDDDESRATSVDPTLFERQGIPPAARGTRRTNHVCSIKICHNLLSPSNPWKMCDPCRARDREARRIKALRDSGIMVDPLPPRVPREPREKKEKKQSKKEGKQKAASQSQSPEESAGDGSTLVFMDPLLPGGQPISESLGEYAAGAGGLSFILADEEGNITEPPPPKPVGTQDNGSSAATENGTAAKQKTSKRATKNPENTPSSSTASAAAGPFTQVTQPSAPAPHQPPGAFIAGNIQKPPTAPGVPPHPQYPYPYYVPPYPLPPYPPPPGMQFSYGPPPPPGYPRDAYPPPPPPPMFAPPYYPPFPPPYAYTFPFPRPPVPAVSISSGPAQDPPPALNPTYGTFSATPGKGDKTYNLQAPPDGTPLKYTFSSRTGAAWGTPASADPSAPKKKRRRAVIAGPEEAEPSLKRQGSGEQMSGEGVALQNTPEAAILGENVASNAEGRAPATDTNTENVHLNNMNEPNSDERNAECNNKTCHRLLGPNVAGPLCDRCRDRMKKKAMKVKQRFKLEPKRLAARTATGDTDDRNDIEHVEGILSR